MQRGMIRHWKFPLEEILPFIGERRHVFHTPKRKFGIKLADNRMLLLGHTQHCAACFLIGNHFWLEHSGCFPPHLNLYGYNEHHHEVMLTMDHIMPRSKGGGSVLVNLQLLCKVCNMLKKNKLLTAEEIGTIRYKSSHKGFRYFMDRNRQKVQEKSLGVAKAL